MDAWPEFPGFIPEDLEVAILANPEESARAICRVTKRSIAIALGRGE